MGISTSFPLLFSCKNNKTSCTKCKIKSKAKRKGHFQFNLRACFLKLVNHICFSRYFLLEDLMSGTWRDGNLTMLWRHGPHQVELLFSPRVLVSCVEDSRVYWFLLACNKTVTLYQDKLSTDKKQTV